MIFLLQNGIFLAENYQNLENSNVALKMFLALFGQSVS
jgi:hypothetical protein